MAEKKSTSDKIQQLGSTIANIAKMAKHLANPVIFWTVVIILIIILLIGIIGFFVAIAGKIAGFITQLTDKLLHSSDVGITVKDDDIKNLCEYIESMGYDLEGYGFVEEITRDKEPTYDQIEYDGAEKQPTKGELKSVKSKYLTAYLIAEKKTYLISNVSSSELQSDLAIVGKNLLIPLYYAAFWEEDSFYQQKVKAIKDEATQRLNAASMLIQISNTTFEQLWPTSKKTPEGTIFEQGINEMYDYDAESKTYKIRPTYKLTETENGHAINTYDEINAEDLRESIGGMFLGHQIAPLFYDFNTAGILQTLGTIWDTFWGQFTNPLLLIGSVLDQYNVANANSTAATHAFIQMATNQDSEEAKAGMRCLYLYAKKFMGAMDDESKGVYTTYLEINTIKLTAGETGYLTANKGMIYIEGAEEAGHVKLTELFDVPDKYTFEVDEESRALIIKTHYGTENGGGGSIGVALGLGNYSRYMFSLNNVLTKYGKPVEFMIAVHTSTMAPDFAYKLATSPEVDTTVHLKTFETGATFTIVDDKRSNNSIEAIIDDLYTTTDEEANRLSILKNMTFQTSGKNVLTDLADTYAEGYSESNLKNIADRIKSGELTLTPPIETNEKSDEQIYSDIKRRISSTIRTRLVNAKSIEAFFSLCDRLGNNQEKVFDKPSSNGQSLKSAGGKIESLKNIKLTTILGFDCTYNDIWKRDRIKF
ncbi:MAG: hypothetical protein IKP28_02395 [Clostridia bacterium]|nr:hypothetical protein [Clostridia bacterium]